MMKTAENWSRCDGANGLDRPMDRGILVQSTMSPGTVVVDGILAKDPPQMSFAEHHEVVDALPSDRADQSLRPPFCQGDPGAIGLSRMPMARSRRLTAVP